MKICSTCFILLVLLPVVTEILRKVIVLHGSKIWKFISMTITMCDEKVSEK